MIDTTQQSRLRPEVWGTFTRDQVQALAEPIEWLGPVAAERQALEQAAMDELQREARAALDAVPDAVAVEIERGQIVRTVHE